MKPKAVFLFRLFSTTSETRQFANNIKQVELNLFKSFALI